MVYTEDVKLDRKYIQDNTTTISFSVIIEQSNDKKYGLKLRPWCKLYPKKGHHDKIIEILIRNGVNINDDGRYIVIKNISPCMLAMKFLDPPTWWKKTLNMMKDGLHNTKKGIIKIAKKRNEKSKSVNANRRWTVDKVIERISENS